MATRRTGGKRRPRKAAAPRPAPIDDDLALAEELVRQARKDQPVIDTEWKKFREFLKQRGIPVPDKPIGAKKLREMGIREGLDPEGTEFSRGIIEMREE
jgi:hypothetical protein